MSNISGSVNLNLDVNVNDLIKDIADRCQKIGRAEIVQKILDELNKSHQTFKWSQGFDSHDFAVYLFRDGMFDHGGEHGGYINWAFTGGHRFPSPWGNHDRDQYVVWGNLTNRVGGNGGGQEYALYFYEMQIDRITVTKDWDRGRGVHHVSAIIFHFRNIGHSEQMIGKRQRESDTVHFQPNERIERIGVKHENGIINAINFHINDLSSGNRRESGWFGGNRGNEHFFNETPKGIFGRHGIYLDSLGIIY